MNTCPLCGKPQHTYTQPGYLHLPARDYATCKNPRCAIEGVTLEVGQHARLTLREAWSYKQARIRSSRLAVTA